MVWLCLWRWVTSWFNQGCWFTFIYTWLMARKKWLHGRGEMHPLYMYCIPSHYWWCCKLSTAIGLNNFTLIVGYMPQEGREHSCLTVSNTSEFTVGGSQTKNVSCYLQRYVWVYWLHVGHASGIAMDGFRSKDCHEILYAWSPSGWPLLTWLMLLSQVPLWSWHFCYFNEMLA